MRPCRCTGNVLNQVVDGDTKSDSHEQVSDHGDWSEVLEVWNTPQQDEGQQKGGNVHPLVQLDVGVILYDLWAGESSLCNCWYKHHSSRLQITNRPVISTNRTLLRYL